MSTSSPFSQIDAILEDARAGRMFVLCDDTSEPGAGYLAVPAECGTAEIVNFMALHARGLICLSLSSERVAALGLEQMATRYRQAAQTPFTLSIEAAEGITTGISAADRARTIAVAHDPAFGAAAIVTPGHVFPLRAQPGGVLDHPGPAEASVDICRLAGRLPSAALSSILRDDGEVAGLDDLVTFATRHQMKIGRITDLVAHRLLNDTSITQAPVRTVRTRDGEDWALTVAVDQSSGDRYYVMTKGRIESETTAPVYFRRFDPVTEILGSGTQTHEIDRMLKQISGTGAGILILHLGDSPEAAGVTARATDKLDFLRSARVLKSLGVSRVKLMNDTILPSPEVSQAFGLVVETAETGC